MLSIKTLFLILIFLWIPLNAISIDIENDINSSSIKNDSVKFSFELGAKTDFWSPGLPKNVIDYKTEGLFLGYGKIKLKLYDSDVLSIEKYTTFSSSNNQHDLLEYYIDDKKHDSTINGVNISVQVMKILNYLFEQEWLNGFNYEYNSRNFIGDAKLKTNSVYWYGEIDGGVLNQDFSLLEKGDRLSFKTKFNSHKLYYQWENISKQIKGVYTSLGVFDEEWSKPTFIGDTSLKGDLPIIFDANYYTQGITTAMGIKNQHYNIKAFFDYGIDNEIKVIQQSHSSTNLNKDVNMYMMGLNADYRFTDIYRNNKFTTDIIVGTQLQYNKIQQDENIELDAEKLYSFHTGIEIIF